MHQQLHAGFDRGSVTEFDHFPELVRRVDVQEQERDLTRVECFLGQTKHYGRILADRIQHHGPLELRSHLADDMDTFSLECL
jgi:hypothetical protein